jgi:protein-disulfide isomerase
VRQNALVSHRQDQKAAARAAREEAERRSAADVSRRRTLTLAGVLALAALAVVLVVVLASGGGSSDDGPKAGEPAPGGPETEALLGGIPQDGLTLGKPKATLTMIEFNDMQCPVCKEYDAKVFPTLIDRYVKTGQMRMEMKLQSFIGPDSVTAGRAVAAAGAQDRAWTFEHLFYVNQGTENTGYVTDDFLRSVASADKEIDVDRLMADRNKAFAQKALNDGAAAFKASGFEGTPSFLIGRTGGALRPLRFNALEPEVFTKQIDALLGQ